MARPSILAGLSVLARDGIKLATDVHLPRAGKGPWPAVVLRTPYRRRQQFVMKLAQELAKRGIAAVLQDTRGRFGSDGVLEFAWEEADSLSTLEWLSGQSWCDGRIGTLGNSISTFQACLMATMPEPPGIDMRAVVNIMGVVDFYSHFYRNGALLHHWALPWSVMMDQGGGDGDQTWNRFEWPELYRRLPLADTGRPSEADSRVWQWATRDASRTPAWRGFDVRPRLAQAIVPILHIGGWYDFMLQQVLAAYGLGGDGNDHRLVVGPWDHQSLFSSFHFKSNGKSGGEVGARESLNLTELIMGWFEKWLLDSKASGASRAFEREPRALAFLMEDERWLGIDDFPPSGAETQDWYLGSNGRAATASGDGLLTRSAPRSAGSDSFLYHPADPVPTEGGAIWPFLSSGLWPGPADQRAIEERQDVLVYTAPPLDQEVIVLGPLQVELWASTSAPDTDFTAKLVDVAPDGTVRIIQDGIVRCRFRAGESRVELLEPNRPYQLTIDLAATAHCFRAGNRIRLEVSSSNFPKYDRNLNTGRPPNRDSAGLLARQVVFHGDGMPSRLRLTVLAPEAAKACSWRPPPAWTAGDTHETAQSEAQRARGNPQTEA